MAQDASLGVYYSTRDAVNEFCRMMERLGYGHTSQDDAIRILLSAAVDAVENDREIQVRNLAAIRDFLNSKNHIRLRDLHEVTV